MVETRLCKLRGTSMFSLIYTVVVHKIYGRSFARVIYLILMKDIGRRT